MTCPLKYNKFGTGECLPDCAFMTTDGCLLIQLMMKHIHEDYDPITKLVNENIHFKPPREEKYP